MAETGSRRPRRRFTEEFKQQAVRLVLDEGKSVVKAAAIGFIHLVASIPAFIIILTLAAIAS